jgi:hypothetical protein
MSLEAEDGVRVVTPIVFFAAGSTESAPLNQITKVEPEGDKEQQEKPAPKGSSAPASASSSSEPVVPVETPTVPPSPSSLVPPAPPASPATAGKDSGQPKESENSTPAG